MATATIVRPYTGEELRAHHGTWSAVPTRVNPS
jgi:hypothetical protein